MTEEWHFQYPSTSVAKTHKGDITYSETFSGDASKLLYELKNLMKFRQLGQLKMVRLFTDGTIITAKSHFGYDSVEIDVSKSKVSLAIVPGVTCTITLLDLPDVIPPMRYPGEIHEGEVEGIDYIKTYYTLDVTNCTTCTEIQWNLCLLPTEECETFYFEDDSLPHYDIPDPALDDPKDHCQYTLSQPCQAEIIESGSDGGGTYIIWKAYTEDVGGTLTRTGLGWMQMRPHIDTDDDVERCFAEEIIKVDCCEKDVSDRQTTMYWTWCPGTLGGVGPCPVPEESQSYGVLLWFTYNILPLSASPEKSGSCIPFEWALSGYGTLTIDPEDTLKLGANYSAGTVGCQDISVITLTDRCGTKDTLTFTPCCSGASALVIGYTSLQMGCGASQDLTVSGGCPTYTWSLSGGGSLEPDEGSTVTYKAPDTNPGCNNNPTISVTDCCGSTAEVKLAINCYVGGFAFQDTEQELCGACLYHPEVDWWTAYVRGWVENFDCGGVFINGCYWNMDCALSYLSIEDCPITNCGTAGCGGSVGCGYVDKRTVEMIEQGCCPINPATGLPF